tara:strand:+ start:2362 stop:2718 length:357 start_codon:yes stop_codon:yes gene_type:complete
MPLITLPFNFDLNVSVQVGDTAYYVPTTTSSTFNINSSAIIEIGLVTIVNQVNNTIVCNTFLIPSNYPSSGDFILFSKDNKANMTSLLGYYAKVKVRNSSKSKAEMFKISADYFESSK